MTPPSAPRFVFRRTEENRNSLAALRLALAGMERRGLLSTGLAAGPPEGLGPGDVLAWSFSTVDLDAVAAEVRPLAGAPGRPLLIAGGPHPSADPEGLLALGFDAVFVGEAERTLPAFAAAFCERKEREWVAGSPVFRDAGDAFDLDASPHACDETEEFPFVEIARGCPHACAFCQVPSLHGRRRRFRSPATAAAGVASAVARGHRRFRFLAPDAFAYRGSGGAPEEALGALLGACRAVGASTLMLGSFPSEVRPDHVTGGLVALVASACANRTIVIGAQSGSDGTLALMRRGHTVEDSRRAIRLVAEAGLVPHVDLLFGFPGETREGRLRSLDLGREVLALGESRLHLHAYLPLPGAAAWPAPPERLEPEIVRALRELQAGGRADGWWERQIGQGSRVMEQLRAGLIRAQ